MTKAEIIALAERCERAEGPDRELDQAIYVTIGSPVVRIASSSTYCTDLVNWAPFYTQSLDAAMTLVPEGLFPTIDFVSKRVWVRDAKGFDVGFGPAYGFAATVPLSICAASLRAIAEGMEDEG